MAKQQDSHRRAVEAFEDAKEAMRENHARMRDDLRFSNPAHPQQWDSQALDLRKGRPCLTFDRTYQFVTQVMNQGRQSKPAIHCLPANSDAHEDVAEKLNGIIRHIEYVSRADIAYDTGFESAVQIGLGWVRIVPEVMRPETNEQEIRIKRIADPLSCHLEAGWMEPDGSDAMQGFIETMLPIADFKRQWPKAKTESWESEGSGWFDDKQVRICEHLKVVETKINRLTIDFEGQQLTVSEDEYWQLRQRTGIQIPATPFEAKKRTVTWSKLSGCETLEETEFPSQYIPLVPIIGHEVLVDGKRYLCGMVRRLMDSQRAYNYERSAFIESVAMQPKAPFLVDGQSIEGYEEHWARLNQGNPAYLPYNSVNESGQPLTPPARQMPPPFPTAFAQGGQIATQDMESAVGMFRANLGAPSQAVSGRAKREDKVAGDTANFHYTDNRNRSIAQIGRIVVDMIPRVIDTKRQARIMGEDGSHDFVQVDPEMNRASKREQIQAKDPQTGQPMMREGKKVVAINPGVGAYDVRVKAGPAYTTLREESAEQLANLMQAAPNLMPILGDLWISMQDWPEAEKATKRMHLMLPPQIQEMEQDGGEEISPQAQAQLGQAKQQIEQLTQMLQNAHEQVVALEGKQQAELQKEQMRIQAQREIEAARLQAANQREADKHDRSLQVEDSKHVRALQVQDDKHAKASEIEHIKAEVSAGIEAMKRDTAIQLQSMKDATSHLVAEISGMVTLLAKQIAPPPQVVAEASKETA